MEISQYLNIARRRIRLFLLIPLIAAAIAVGAVLIGTERRYIATATVTTTSLSTLAGNQFAGPQGNRVLLETFSAAASTPSVLDRVSERTGVAPPTLEESGAISVSPIGESSLLRVTARMPQNRQAIEVAGAVSAESMKYLLEPQIRLAAKTAEQARTTVTDTQAQLSELARSSGLALGMPDYEMKARAVSALREEVLRARSAGQATLAANLERNLNSQSAELAALAPKLAEFQTLTELNKQALVRLNEALSTEERGRALQASADAGDLISMSEPRRSRIGPALLRSALGALGAGIFLAAMIVVLLEFLVRGEGSLLAPGRRSATREPERNEMPLLETAPLREEPEAS